MHSPLHTAYLLNALAWAKKRQGFCAPNPAVGAVVVRKGQIIAYGYHWKAGDPHAEAVALSQLTVEETTGADLYVTLEPCAHYGKTPPCTDLILHHQLKQVYYGFKDPNPQVCGQGEKLLRDHQIPCTQIVVPAIQEFYRAYAHWTRYRTPWVTAKLALSLDGKIAGSQGRSVAITGEKTRQFTHQQRAESDAILTTVTTVLCDDPQLNVRLDTTWSKPIYLLDRQLHFPLGARLMQTADTITVFHDPSASPERRAQFTQKGLTCIPVIDPHEVLSYIGERGVHRLWMETGGKCFESWLSQNHIQQAYIYVALKWLGSQAQSAFSKDTALFTCVRHIRWHTLGEDAICEILTCSPDT